MIDPSPNLSIGLIVYNGENFLAEALDSLLDQTFTDFELIISDNASTDRTEEICHDYRSRDRRIRYVRNKRNLGAARNFNQTVELSRGDYFKCATHDDLYAPTFLERCVEVLHSDPGVVLCHCSVKVIDGSGQPLPFDEDLGYYFDPLGQPYKPELPFPAESNTPAKRFRDVLFRVRHNFPIYGVIRTEVLRSTSLYKNFYGADKLLLAELALRGRFKQIEEPLFIKRVHLQMSSYLSKEEKWQQTNADIPMERQFLRWPRAYLPAALAAPLALPERLRCLSVLLEKKLERTIRFRKEKIHH